MSSTECPNRNTLFDYLVGKLPDDASDSLSDHVEACPDCQAELATLSDIEDTLIGRLRGDAQPEPYLDESECSRAIAKAKILDGQTGTAPFSPELSEASLSIQLGEYQLIERLGAGGMGAVYKALHSRLDRVVALKILPQSRTADQRAIVRFEREMKAIGRLDNSHIVRAYDAREIEGRLVLVMEFVEGLDWGKIIRRIGALGKGDRHLFPERPSGCVAEKVPVPFSDACELARQAALGLQAAHEYDMVHRDVKPSNLMLTPEGEVKLLDLGLARFQRDPAAEEEMTGTGQAMGTADYMAPEQTSDSRAVDIRADIYGLGATLYKLLSGRAPFSGPEYQSAFEKMLAHRQAPPPPIEQFCPEIPEGLAAVLNRMLAKDPNDRYATPNEVAEALTPFCAGSDLPGLLQAARLQSEPRRSVASGESRSVHASRTAVVPAALADRNPRVLPAPRRWRTVVIALVALLLVGGLGFSLGILLRVHDKDGQVTEVDLAKGSKARVDEKGNIDVTPPGSISNEARNQDATLKTKIAELTGKLAAKKVRLKNVDNPDYTSYQLEITDPYATQLREELHNKKAQCDKMGKHENSEPLRREIKEVQKRYDNRIAELRKMAREQQRGETEAEIIELEAQLKEAQLQKDAPLQFGPVIERVLNARSEDKGSDAIDLRSGKLIDLPNDFIEWSVEKRGRWCAENNVDLSVDTFDTFNRQGMCWAPHGLRLASIKSDSWTSVTAEELRLALNQPTKKADVGHAPIEESKEPGTTVFMSEMQAMTAFQTRKGDLGILQVLSWTTNPKGLKIRYKLVQPEGSAVAAVATGQPDASPQPFSRQPANTVQFGPVIERVINSAAEHTGNDAINLATGRLSDLPKDFDLSKLKEPRSWFIDNDVDLVAAFDNAGSGGNYGVLTTGGLTLAAAHNERWGNEITERQLREILDSPTPGFVMGDGVLAEVRESRGAMSFRLTQHAPVTFAFKTLKGQTGILQVIRYTEDPPGFRIRYKLVQPSATAANPPAATPPAASGVDPVAELNALQGQWNIVGVEKGKDTPAAWGAIMGNAVYLSAIVDPAIISRIDFNATNEPLQFVARQPMSIGGGMRRRGFKYRLDPTANPKTIDILPENAGNAVYLGGATAVDPVALGIYKIDGDRLTIRITRFVPELKSEQRPKDFSVDLNSGDVLFSAERRQRPADERTIQGWWPVVSWIHDGKPDPETKIRKLQCCFSDYDLQIADPTTEQSVVLWGDYALDATKPNKTITIFNWDASLQNRGVHHGIYKLEELQLTIAYRQGNKPPESFESKRGSGVTLLVLKRDKPKPTADTDAAPIAALQALQGQWKVEHVEKGKESDAVWGAIAGEQKPLDPATTDRLAFDKSYDGLSLRLLRPTPTTVAAGIDTTFESAKCVQGFDYRIDPTKSPATIDFLVGGDHPSNMTEGRTSALGIYKIENDQLTICLRRTYPEIQTNLRPTNFAVDPTSGDILFTLKRYQPTADEKAIQSPTGWTLVEKTVDGKPVAAVDKPQPVAWTFRDNNRFSFSVPGSDKALPTWSYSVYFLDSTKQPKTITIHNDCWTNEGRDSKYLLDKKPDHGIYKIENDRLTIALAKGPTPPKDFESKPNSGVTLMVFKKREVPKNLGGGMGGGMMGGMGGGMGGGINGGLGGGMNGAITSPTASPIVNSAAEFKALKGTWKVVKIQKESDADDAWPAHGRDVSVAKLDRLIFGDNYLEMLSLHDGSSATLKYRINPTASPKTIDLHEQGQNGQFGDTFALGCYTVNGNRLAIRLARFVPVVAGDQRPNHVEGDPISGSILLILERYFHQPSEDEKALQGDWAMVNYITDGKPAPQQTMQLAKAIFSSEFFMVRGTKIAYVIPRELNALGHGSVVLRPDTKPKSLTLFNSHQFDDEGHFATNRPPEKLSGIYKLDANRLTIAFRKGDSPPESFESKPGSGVILIELTKGVPTRPESGDKTAPSAPSVNAAAELNALQGRWKVVRVEKGKDLKPWAIYTTSPACNAEDIAVWEFRNNLVSFRFKDPEGGIGLSYRIDPTVSPKTLDLIGNSPANGLPPPFSALGVYELDGDHLKICIAQHMPSLKTDQRPANFSIDPNSANVLFTLEREKTETAPPTPATQHPPKPVAFRTAAVKRGRWAQGIGDNVQAWIRPKVVQRVSTFIGGQIVEIGEDPRAKTDPKYKGKPIEYGTPVEEGTILAKIDDTQIKAEVAQAEKAVAHFTAKVKEEQSKAKKGVVTQAEADLARWQENLKSAKYILEEQSIIRSPMKGVVIARRVNVGHTVPGRVPTVLMPSLPSHLSASLFDIADDIQLMQIQLNVGEDIGTKIRKETEVIVYAAAPNGQLDPNDVLQLQKAIKVKGVIKLMSLNGSQSPRGTEYSVVIDVPNPDGKIRPNANAVVKFVESYQDALLVSGQVFRWSPRSELLTAEAAAALNEIRQNAQKSFWVKTPDGQHVQPVAVESCRSTEEGYAVTGPDVKEGLEAVIADEPATP